MKEKKKRQRSSEYYAQAINKTDNDFRKTQKLKPVNTGKIDCLRCENNFHSEDIKTIRLCGGCRGFAERHDYGE